MRMIRVYEAKANMVVNKDIYNSDGRVLVAKGVKLTERYIERLRDFNVKAIEILQEQEIREAHRLANIDTCKVTKEELELHINRSVKSLIKTSLGKPDLMLQVEEAFDLILQDQAVVENMFKTKLIGDRTFFHGVQVAVLAVATGLQLELDRPSLTLLGKAAMLFDIGKIFLRRDLLIHQEEYDETQKLIMQEHTISGYMLLRSIFPEEVALVALQHHERFNGSGYPRNLSNDELHLFSRIVSVADVFIALKSHRYYRQAFQPYEALEYILGAGGYLFDSKVVSAFNEIIVLYALGTVVQLNDGRSGIVTALHPVFGQRPEVTVLYDEQMQPISGEVLDLAAHPTSFIVRVLHE
ncbi:HD-GYP domain-containing protein [Cohnella fermenti]|uniref:HD domain-containing protein n=1 Tax=Cohnella fermenti TaxID=2565925 RepID=A0A4S4BP22_9BACL|nr:HD domain-containing phosphohydrolase [Cohnella fermenti]THF76588.1 HD domain-containing protein [Cohnella fermenti]